MTTISRRLRVWAWGLRLLLVLAASGPVLAQDDPNAFGGGQETGDPLYGYLATGVLAAGVIFVLCKSSRRAA